MKLPLIHALGTTVQVKLGEDIDPDEFATAWSRCLTHPPQTTSDERTPAEAPPAVTGQRSMTSLTQAVTRALIERRAGELLMFHAGAVSHPRTGASIAYVAPGGTGKTTLSRLLGRTYGYLTDETVGIEPGSWRIHSYEKPLSTRTDAGGYPKTERGPEELGLLPAHPEPRLTTLAILRRTPDLPRASMTELDLFDAITTLAPETSSLPRLDRPLHLLADLYADLGGVWLLEYAEADHLQDWISTRLAEA